MKRSRGFSDCFFVISTDWDFVRFARLEDINAIYVQQPDLDIGGSEFLSVRYDLNKKDFIVCLLHDLLWELAQLFDHVRLRNEETEQTLEMQYMYEGKTMGDWERDVLKVTLPNSND